MLRGLPASILLHGAIVFGGTIAWPYIAPEREVEILIPVTMDVQLDVVTNIAPVVRRETAPEDPEKEPEEEAIEEDVPIEEESEEVEVAEDEMDTTDVRELPQEEEPEEESIAVDEDPEEEDEPEEPEEEEEVKAKPRRNPDDLDSILGDASALFSEQKQTKRNPVTPREKKIDLKDETEVKDPRKGVGDKSKETARVEAMIASKMSVCWDDVVDLPNPERLNVVIRVKLEKDGSLDGDVELVNPRRAPIGDRPMSVAVERALRAARKCAPYKLPTDALASYDEWKDITFRIGPGFGG